MSAYTDSLPDYQGMPRVTKRRPGRKRGRLPRAMVNIPEFYNLGHAPIGSISWHMKPYRKYFDNMRAVDIAVQAVRTCGAHHPILPIILKEWWLLPKHDQEKTLALDYLVEAFNMSVDEFVVIAVGRIHNLLIERMKGMQLANLPLVLEASMKRAQSTKPSTAAMKEAQMHLQQHNFVPAAPSSEINISTQVAAGNTPFQLPDAAEWSKRLDEAARAGQQALPPADMENVIEAEVVEEKVAV